MLQPSRSTLSRVHRRAGILLGKRVSMPLEGTMVLRSGQVDASYDFAGRGVLADGHTNRGD